MEKVFTLDELKQIKKDYFSYSSFIYLCHISKVFQEKWNNMDTKLSIIDLTRAFLKDSKLEHCYKSPTTGSLFLFYPKEIIINSDKDDRKKIRIEFLDWLIENTES